MGLNSAHFRKTLMYEASAPAARVQADLHQLRALDRVAERGERRWSLACGAALLASIAAFVGVAATDGADPRAWGVLGGCLVAAIVCWALGARAGRVDLEDRRYELLARLLRLLELDLASTEPVEVRLDLRPAAAAERTQGPAADGWEVTTSAVPWLELRTRLLDGTACEIGAVERREARSRLTAAGERQRERSATTVFTTRLQPAAARYGAWAGLAGEVEQAVRLPEHAQLRAAEVSDEALRLEAVTAAAWGAAPPGGVLEQGEDGPEVVALMLLSLYDVLERARRAAAAPTAS